MYDGVGSGKLARKLILRVSINDVSRRDTRDGR